MKIAKKRIDFRKGNGIVPAVVQDWRTKEVLCLFYMDSEALEKTIETKKLWRYSRQKGKVIMKGKESGNEMEVKGVFSDCDNDALLIDVEVKGKGKACHNGEKSCFFNRIYEKEEGNGRVGNGRNGNAGRKTLGKTILQELEEVINERKNNPKRNSYTSETVADVKKISEKIIEESREYVEALEKKDEKEVVWEATDLLYFLMLGLANRNVRMEKVFAELERRRNGGRKELKTTER